MKSFNEIIDYIVKAGKGKTEKGVKALSMQDILSGMFIAIGAIGYFNLVAYTTDPGLGKFLGALIFPTGIIAVLLQSLQKKASPTSVGGDEFCVF